MKICIECNLKKSLTEYQFRSDTKKYRNQCKRCRQNKINEYRRNNFEYKKRYNKYRKIRRDTDTSYCMQERLRARLRKIYKLQNVDKCDKTLDMLGCSINEFKLHIISNFYGDMDWDKKNFVLDHRIPCAWFDISNIKHAKYCFSYRNIYPMTHKDNEKKSDRVWIEYNIMKNPYI